MYLTMRIVVLRERKSSGVVKGELSQVTPPNAYRE